MDNVLQNWGIAGMTITPIDSPGKSTWDIGGKYVLKRFANADELTRNVQFTKLLADENIPVAKYIPMTDGQITKTGCLYCLMTKIPGLCADFYEQPDLAYEMGRELARLHIALARIEPKIPCTNNDFLADWENNIQSGVIGTVPDDILKQVNTQFHRLYPKLPRQLIHRDVHCYNALFDGGQLTAWLDFDLGQRNARLFDVAYLMAGLVLGETHDPVRVEIWHSLCNAIISGYNEINLLNADERDALPVLMIVIEFLFAYFWNLRENLEQRNTALDLAQWLFHEYKM